jgi:protoheme IX farnesyltransferase
MKPDVAVSPGPGGAITARTRVNDLAVLTKARLNALVVATSAGGYYMAARPVDPATLVVTALGTGLVACGAAAINQVDERDIDRLMQRTRLRPVADGRMSPGEGRAIALALSAAGLVLLWLGANVTAAIIALATLLIYAFVYTPMKRRTSLATVVGAIPGALPPLIGWTAASGSLAHPGAWALFSIMFVWQLPHFLAIAWMCREDYARGGLPMLSVIDRHGRLTGLQAMLWAATLVPLSQLPLLAGLTTGTYAAGALVLGIGHFVLAATFARRPTDANARALFYGSITYLPLLWTLMAIARSPF